MSKEDKSVIYTEGLKQINLSKSEIILREQGNVYRLLIASFPDKFSFLNAKMPSRGRAVVSKQGRLMGSPRMLLRKALPDFSFLQASQLAQPTVCSGYTFSVQWGRRAGTAFHFFLPMPLAGVTTAHLFPSQIQPTLDLSFPSRLHISQKDRVISRYSCSALNLSDCLK